MQRAIFYERAAAARMKEMSIDPSFWVEKVVAAQTKDIHYQSLFPCMSEIVLNQSEIKTFQLTVAALDWATLLPKLAPDSFTNYFLSQTQQDQLAADLGEPLPRHKKLVGCVFGWLRKGLEELPAFDVAFRVLPALLVQYSTTMAVWSHLVNQILFIFTEKWVASQIAFLKRTSQQRVLYSYLGTKCLGTRVSVATKVIYEERVFPGHHESKSAVVTNWQTNWSHQGIGDPQVTLECDDGSIYSGLQLMSNSLLVLSSLNDTANSFRIFHFAGGQPTFSEIIERCGQERKRKQDLFFLFERLLPSPIIDLCMSYSNTVYDAPVPTKKHFPQDDDSEITWAVMKRFCQLKG